MMSRTGRRCSEAGAECLLGIRRSLTRSEASPHRSAGPAEARRRSTDARSLFRQRSLAKTVAARGIWRAAQLAPNQGHLVARRDAPRVLGKTAGFLLLDTMLAAAIVGTSLVVVVASVGRAMAASQAVAQQVAAHEVAGRVLTEAMLQTDLAQQGGLIPKGSDPVGVDGADRQGWSGDPLLDPGGELGRSEASSGGGSECQPSVYIEEGGGVEWLRAEAVWEGVGGRGERVERVMPVRVVDGGG